MNKEMDSAPAPAARPSRSTLAPWLVVALLGHTAWGVYPVLGRYLQTVSHIPSMMLLTVGYLPLAIVFGVWAWPRYGKVFLGSRSLWVFALIVVIRSITNILAARYTLAIYVQLITLMTPFLIAFLSTLVLHEELPRGTYPAIVLSFLGSLLMMSSEVSSEGIRFGLTRSDWIGIGLALGSAIFLAFYMIAAGRTAQFAMPGLVILLFQSTVIMSGSALASLAVREDWSVWLHLSRSDWAAMLFYMGFIVVGANWLQITSLRHLGAPVVSSLMGWRLVSTLFVGILLLGEGLDSWLQVVGMLIVLATVTWYLWSRR